MEKELDIIVIGGGLAGLGAVRTLCNNGNLDVVLLEADSVVGGRVMNGNLISDGTSLRVPLGAASFHGRKGNSLLNYAKAEDLANSKEYLIENDNILHTFSGGKEIPIHVIDYVEDEVEEILEVGIKQDLSSLSTTKDKVDNGTEMQCPLDLHDFIKLKMDPIFHGDLLQQHDPTVILEGILSYEGITEGSKGLHGIDLMLYGSWLYLDENTDILYKDNPFCVIIDSLVSKIPNGVIKCNKEVCTIDRSNQEKDTPGSDHIIVKCTDGSTYIAKHIIYTCSLGVLKHHATPASGVFVPTLSPTKLTAINDVGMSLVNKVFLQFDGPLLSSSPHYDQFRFYWTESDKMNSQFACNPWIMGLQFLRIFPNESDHFLYHTFFLGEDAAAIEVIDECKVAKVIIYALQMFLAKPIPKLLEIKISKWGKSFTRGSYSYNPQGITLDKRQELGRPVANKYYPLQIMFAGEATSIDQFGCSHSAYDSGVKEAKRLINYYD